MKKILLGILITALFIVGCEEQLPPEPGTPGAPVGEAIIDYDYAEDGYPYLTLSPTSLNIGETVTVNIADLDYVWKLAYVRKGNEWKSFTLTGTTVKGNWIKNPTPYDLDTAGFSAGTKDVLVYGCYRQGTSFYCFYGKWLGAEFILNQALDGDSSKAVCEQRNHVWQIKSGEEDPHGEYDLDDLKDNVLECCGDDDNEYYEYFRVFAANTAEVLGKLGRNKDTDRACCDNANDCVYNGKCYARDNYYDLDGDGKKDYYCYRGGDGYWINVDYHTSYCTANGFNWNTGYGDADTEGDYYSTVQSRPDYCAIGSSGTPSIECCCGDDADEYYLEGSDGTKACCDNPSDIVENGECVELTTPGTPGE